MQVQLYYPLIALCFFFLLWSCPAPQPEPQSSPTTPPEAQNQSLHIRAKKYFQPLPPKIPAPPQQEDSPEKVQLGRRLFYDPRLSAKGNLRCNSCHDLARYGTDHQETAIGPESKPHVRNTPSVFHAGFQFAQNWDGSKTNLETHAQAHLLDPLIMGATEKELLDRLKNIPAYQTEFAQLFKDHQTPLSLENLAQALAAFERSLVTPSVFDSFLKGENHGLSAEAQKGLALFIEKGCISCHKGQALGGETHEVFGVFKPYKYRKDLGRYSQTQDLDDKYRFKVPSLRNSEKTAPYFHDGKVWDLEEAIQIMGESQLGLILEPEEKSALAAFLKSLTGPIPEQMRIIPVLPPATTQAKK